MRGVVAAAWLLAVLALLSGCGSTPLSVSQLHSSATRICQQATKRGQQIRMPSSPSASAAFVKSGIAVLGTELDELRTLKPPSNSASTFSSALDALAEQLRLLREGLSRLGAGADPVHEVRQLQAALAPSESRADADWRALGIPACATA